MVEIGTDLFLFHNKDHVIVVDYTSKFFEISRLPITEASTVINHTKAIFSCYVIPREVVSDNGPQFTSYEYKNFSQGWDFKHVTSNPRYLNSSNQSFGDVGQTYSHLQCHASQQSVSDF